MGPKASIVGEERIRFQQSSMHASIVICSICVLCCLLLLLFGNTPSTQQNLVITDTHYHVDTVLSSFAVTVAQQLSIRTSENGRAQLAW